jgi:peptide/nickel transport system substrate-binding protein
MDMEEVRRVRNALRMLVTLGLAAACAACGGGDTGARSLSGLPAFCQEVLPRVDAYLSQFQQPQGERYGGTVVIGEIGEMPTGMNALVSQDYDGSQHEQFVNLMSLLRLNANLELEPYLAESWDMSPDGSEVTFHLRDDVFWHDGVQTTAYDVEFTYLRATDPETAFPNASYWNFYERGPDGVEVLDSLTVRVHMQPHAEPLDPWRATAIMPRHLLEDVAPAELRSHPYGTRCPVGNGPFVFESHEADASWSFVRNPSFPEGLGGPPYLDRYVYRIIPEPATLLTELLTHSIDFYVAPTPDHVPRIEADASLQVQTFPFPAYDYVGWNTRRVQLADPRVRRAITLATNREEILQAVRGGYGEVANTGVPPFHWAYLPEIRDSLRYDPERAASLLDEAGWIDRDGDGVRENANGDRLAISIKYNLGNDQRADVAQIMQAQLRPLGIQVTPQVVEWGTLLDQVQTTARDFDGVVLGWVVDFALDDHDQFYSASIDRPFALSGIEDPELDRLLDALEVVTDRDDALRLWREYQYRILELQPYTYLYHVRRLAGVNRRIQGMTLDARGEWATIKDWWIPADQR